jgi:hypothetical protein
MYGDYRVYAMVAAGILIAVGLYRRRQESIG